jgi:alpha-mannosidase
MIRGELGDIWRDALLNQFHDVLPGTSIKMVVDDALEIYGQRLPQAEKLLESALSSLLPVSKAMNGFTPDSADTVILVDPLRLARQQVIEIGTHIADAVDALYQTLPGDRILALAQTNDAGIGSLVRPQAVSSPSATTSGDKHVLTNTHFQLTIEGGRLTSLIDLGLQRELILEGPRAKTGGLMLYEDLPLAYDAWDAEIYHLDCATTINFDSVEVTANGPLRASLTGRAQFGDSEVFVTVGKVQWHVINTSSRLTPCSGTSNHSNDRGFVSTSMPIGMRRTNSSNVSRNPILIEEVD